MLDATCVDAYLHVDTGGTDFPPPPPVFLALQFLTRALPSVLLFPIPSSASIFAATIKVIVVGNGGVGKSSMIRRFCTGEYTDTYKKTIGVDFLEKETFLDSCSQSVTFMVWDTAGQEEFDSLTKSYYRGAQGCVIAFSTVDRDSFEAVEKWKEKVEAEVGKGTIPIVLVQNKVDLIDKAVSSNAEVEAVAKRLKLKLYRTCVSENLNVDKVFEYLGERYVNGDTPAATESAEIPTPAAPVTTTAHADDKKPPPSATSTTASTSASTTAPAASTMGGPADFGDSSTSKQQAASAKESSKKDGKTEVIQIHKPKQRTGGKKKTSCSIL